MKQPRNKTLQQTRSASVREIAKAIIGYLKHHPNACDTADGISRWWLSSDAHREARAVEEALATLVEARLVEARRDPDGRTTYRGTNAV